VEVHRAEAGRTVAPDETCAGFVGIGLTRLGDIAVRRASLSACGGMSMVKRSIVVGGGTAL
jgi:hypothetical protein